MEQDARHSFPAFVDQLAPGAKPFTQTGKDGRKSIHVYLRGYHNNTPGVFEWLSIVWSIKLTREYSLKQIQRKLRLLVLDQDGNQCGWTETSEF